LTDEYKNLDYVFNPGSIAFVGATEAKAKWGFIILNNLLSGGYDGRLYPVNPGHQSIMGFECYPSVRDIPDDVDLTVFTVPGNQVVRAIDDSVAKGVKAALVVSAGFREVGGEGAKLEKELVRKADAAGMVLVGPNGQGVACPKNRLYPWMPNFFPPDGRMGFVCQSGNILNMLIGQALSSGFGVSKAVSSGNEAQQRTEDFLTYFADDRETDVIVSYIEGLEDGRRFLELAREATRLKPIVLLKGGRSSGGVKAARSHTGAMAVEGQLFDSACRQAGIAVTRTIQEAGTTASAFVNRPLPRGRRVAIVTGGGGLGVIAADACADYGLGVAELSRETLDSIGRLLPDHWAPGNPVDLVAGLDLSVIKPVLETIIRSGEADSVLFIFVAAERSRSISTTKTGGKGLDVSHFWDTMTEQLGTVFEELYLLSHELEVPLYVTSNLSPAMGRQRADGAGPAPFADVESACAAISAMAQYYEYRQWMQR
jgi:acyl-CoA synthetase (NDP forming)